MIALSSYVLFEVVVFVAGITLAIDILRQPKFNPGDSVISPLFMGGGGLGLLLGILCLWLLYSAMGRERRQDLPSSVPLWLASLLMGYALSGLVIYILSSLPVNTERPVLDWRIVLATGLIGSILGFFSGGFISWRLHVLLARPSLMDIMPPMEMPAPATPAGPTATPVEVRLSQEMYDAGARHNVRCLMQRLGENYVVQFNWNNPAGNTVTCYISCSPDYPRPLPTDIFVEVSSPAGQSQEHQLDSRSLQGVPENQFFYYVIDQAKRLTN